MKKCTKIFIGWSVIKKENQFSVVLVFDFETFDGIKAVPFAFVFYLGVELNFKRNAAKSQKEFWKD